MKVSQLFIYPVKSLRGISVEQSALTPLGLIYDRHWMVIDDKNQFVTMRKYPFMTRIHTQIKADCLILSTKGMPNMLVPLVSNETSITLNRIFKAVVWNDECDVVDEGTAVGEWLTKALVSNKPLRLVKMAENRKRPQSKPERFGNSTTQFSDASAYLLCNQASLNALNRYLEDQHFPAVEMQRFRPNIVVSGETFPAFVEHQMGGCTLKHTDYQFTICDPCQRCIVPNIDIKTGIKDSKQQPYKSLVTLNPMPENPKAAAFGQNVVLKKGEQALVQLDDELMLEKG